MKVTTNTQKTSATTSVAKHAIHPSGSTLALQCVRSEDLVGKDREIMIEHAGTYYRLRVTRANKLILTK